MKIIRSLLEANQQRTANSAESGNNEKQAQKKPTNKVDRTPASTDSNPQNNKDLKPITGNKTMTGQPVNKVDIEPPFYPAVVKEGKTAVVAFGRMNPPTIGHERLVHIVEKLALDHGATPMVFLSHSHDLKKNPLVYETKLAYAQYAFGNTIVESSANDLIVIAQEVAESFDNIIFVCGSDRVAEYTRKLNHYNGDLYEYANIVVENLHRDVAGDLHESASGTALRLAAASDDMGAFKGLLAKGLRCFAEEIYAEVRGELNELDTRQRAKRALLFAKNRARIQAGLKRARSRRAPGHQLLKRARRLAIKNMRKRITRGVKYEDMSYSQRAMVDQQLKKRKGSIGKLAQRLLPKIAKAEANRKLGTRFKDPLAPTTKSLRENADMLLQMLPEAEYDYELSAKEVKALQEKAAEYDTSYEILETVFRRGIAMWENIEIDMTFNQYGFARVNSFLNGGKAYDADFDLVVEDCERYNLTTDDEEDADGDGKIEGDEREAIDARPAERLITTAPAVGKFNHHKRVSAVNVPNVTPGKPKHAELIRKIYEQLNVPNLDGGLGKRRVDLPQLTNFDAFHKDLTDSGHSLGHDYVTPADLTPTQKHFDQAKVDKLKENGWGDKGIIISNDDYVVDGHHRWLAAHQKGEKIKARRTSLNCDELLDFLKDKSYVETKKLNESRHAISDNPGRGYHGTIDLKTHAPKPPKNPVKKKPGAAAPQKPDEEAERAKHYKKMHKLVRDTTGADAKTAKHYLDSVHGRHLADIHNDVVQHGLAHSNVTDHIKKHFANFQKHYKPELFESVKGILFNEETKSADKKPVLTTVNGKKMFVMRTRKHDLADAGGKDAEDESKNLK